ncbi:MAG: TonB family protein [Bacteroidales bacterium]|nr:TonB family protein [Bacteroidales bacterium]
MKSLDRILLIITLWCGLSVAASAQSGYSELYDSETVTALKSHVDMFTAFDLQGRKAGSEGEKAAAAYVYETMKKYGVEMLTSKDGEIFGVARPGQDTLTSRNVYGFVQGYDKSLSKRYIVVGARMDNLGADSVVVDSQKLPRVYRGANGNASGLSVMLELSRMVAADAFLFRRSVIFIGFGASQESYAGAWYFLNRAFADADCIDAMINLDMLGLNASSFQAYTGSNEDMNKILALAQEQLQPVLPQVTAAEAYPSDHRAFYSAEIPSVAFSTGKYAEHDTDRDVVSILDFNSMERELEYLFNFTKLLSNEEVAPSFKSKSAKNKVADVVYAWYDCDKKPSFLGRQDPRFFLDKWVYQYLKYPDEAVQKGIQGRVSVEFVIDKDGSVVDAEVSKSAHPLLDAEALRVVLASPKWKPAKVKGVTVRSSISIPIEFKLEKKGKNSFGIKK